MGFEVAAIGRGADKAELAKKLGAHHYIDNGATDAAGALQALGGEATPRARQRTAGKELCPAVLDFRACIKKHRSPITVFSMQRKQGASSRSWVAPRTVGLPTRFLSWKVLTSGVRSMIIKIVCGVKLMMPSLGGDSKTKRPKNFLFMPEAEATSPRKLLSNCCTLPLSLGKIASRRD